MDKTIQEALQHLQNANYMRYFEEMDKVVPSSLQNPYQEHKGKFIAGQAAWNFYQQLEVFAKEVDRSLKKESISVVNKSHELERKGLEAAVEALIEKKNFLFLEKVKTSDAEQKFGYDKKISDLEKEIADLRKKIASLT